MRHFHARNAVTALAALALFAPAPAHSQEQSAPLTLADVTRVTLERSPRVRQARARVERADGLAQRTVAPFRQPTLTVSGNYSRLSTAGAQATAGNAANPQNPFTVGLSGTTPGTQTVQLANSTVGTGTTTNSGGSTTRSRQAGGDGENGPQTGGAPDLSQFGFSTSLNQQTASVSLAQRIDLTGLGRAYQSVANAEKAIARDELERTRQEAVFNAATAYYAALRADALIRVSEAAVRQSEEQVRIAESRFAQGEYARSDVLRARAQLANNRQSLISARNQAVISRSALANTMGLDPTAPLSLAADENAALPDLPTLDEEKLIADALAKRPEALLARRNEEKARGNVRIARQGQEPFLTASLNGNYNATEGIPTDRRATGTFGLSLSLPLSDGGVTAGNVRAARADERLAAAQSEEYRNGIRAEVQQAVIALRDAHDRARSALPALDEAREGYRLSESRLKAGAGTQLALYDAQAALVQAETNAVNARYDYLGALARLARAVGG